MPETSFKGGAIRSTFERIRIPFFSRRQRGATPAASAIVPTWSDLRPAVDDLMTAGDAVAMSDVKVSWRPLTEFWRVCRCATAGLALQRLALLRRHPMRRRLQAVTLAWALLALHVLPFVRAGRRRPAAALPAAAAATRRKPPRRRRLSHWCACSNRRGAPHGSTRAAACGGQHRRRDPSCLRLVREPWDTGDVERSKNLPGLLFEADTGLFYDI